MPRFFHHLSLIIFLLFGTNTSIRAQWVNVAPNLLPPMYNNFFAVGAINFNNGIVWGGMTDLWSSSDLGKTWQQHQFGHEIYDICFYDQFTGLIATGSEGIFLTHDGGLTWKNILKSNTKKFYNVSFNSSPNTIHALVFNPSMLVSSTDGGATWYSSGIFGDAGLSFAIALNNSISVFTSNYNPRYVKGWINTSYDLGKTWTNNSSLVDGDSFSLSADSCDANRYYLVNEDWADINNDSSEVYLTTDAGSSWRATLSYVRPYLSGTIATTSNVMYIGAIQPNGILRSSDRGLTWKSIGGPSVAADSRTIAIANAKTVFVLDEMGNIWKTSNSGGDSIFSLPTLRLATENVSTDTLGTSSFQIPIKIEGLGRALDIELILHYDPPTFLSYSGSYSVSNVAIDIPGEQWPGRSKIRVLSGYLQGDILGYAHFNLLDDSAIYPKVWLDSLVILNASAPCELTEFTDDNAATSIITTASGCGVQILFDFLRTGRIAQFRLAPNPSSGDISIISSTDLGEVKIVVFDMLGIQRNLLYANIKKNIATKIILPENNGVYDLQVRSAISSYNFRVVMSR